jgi:tetratricopeptide (TPR) repeat protein
MLKIHPEFITWIVTQEAKRLDEELVMKAHEEFARKITLANEHFSRGQQLQAEGKITRALTEYDLALRLTPQNPKIKAAIRDLKMQQAKEEFGRRSEHAMKMLESGNTQSAREEIRNMLATIPNE